MATFYLDFENGNDASAGTSWATAWKTITNGATAARIAPGDEIRMAKSPNSVSIGNATWTEGSETVTLATAQTTTIDNCEVAWTAGVGGDTTVTRTAATTAGRQGTYSMRFALDGTPQTNRLQAYFATGTLDLSAYDSITLWVYSSATTVAGRWQIALCSDTAGATVVDSFDIPALGVANLWYPVVISKTGGGSLGNSIKSIAVYTGGTAPTASSSLYLDNISACNSTGLNLLSLISKNSSATFSTDMEHWWSINSIDNTTIKLGLGNTSLPIAFTESKYCTQGTGTETVTTYFRRTIKTPIATTSTATVNQIQDAGSAGSLIKFSGGWNTSNTTVDGMTWLDGSNFYGRGIVNNNSYIELNGIGFVRYYNAVETTSGTPLGNVHKFCSVSNSNFGNLHTYETGDIEIYTNGNQGGISLSSNYNSVAYVVSLYDQYALITARNNTVFNKLFVSRPFTPSSSGIRLQNNSNNSLLKNVTVKNSSFRGLALTVFNVTIQNLTITGSADYAIDLLTSGSAYIYNFTSSNNTSGCIRALDANSTGNLYIFNSSIGESTKYNIGSTAPISPNIYFTKIDTNTDNRYVTQLANTLSQTTTRHTASGIAWQTNIISTRITSSNPFYTLIAKIACNANALVTVKAWVKLSHATDIGAKLFVRGGQIAGVSNDVTATKSADTNWEELTVTFTPTETGVVEVHLLSYWLANLADESTYVDDVTVMQA